MLLMVWRIFLSLFTGQSQRNGNGHGLSCLVAQHMGDFEWNSVECFSFYAQKLHERCTPNATYFATSRHVKSLQIFKVFILLKASISTAVRTPSVRFPLTERIFSSPEISHHVILLFSFSGLRTYKNSFQTLRIIWENISKTQLFCNQSNKIPTIYEEFVTQRNNSLSEIPFTVFKMTEYLESSFHITLENGIFSHCNFF